MEPPLERSSRLVDGFGIALAVVASTLFVLLLIELGFHLPFPCDLYIWAESPFMTNMLKLWNRAPFYGDPKDVNGFIYAPGLEYVTWAVLAPFGLALDVRFCRLVSVGLGLAAAATMAATSLRVVADVTGVEAAHVRRGRFLAAAFPLAALLVFSNFTAFVTHPDNIQMLHAALSLFLCHAALRERSFGRALAAVVFSAFGVLTKQTAAFTWVGTLFALLVAGPWRGRSALVLAAAGVAGFACATLPLLGSANARFFAIVLPLRQGMNWSKLMVLFDDLFRGHRLILLTIAPACVLRIVRSGARGREFAIAWAALFCTAALPNLVSYMKDEGSDNNLWILGFWLLPVALANLPGAVQTSGARADSWFLGVRVTAFALLVVSLVPLLVPPGPTAHHYCQTLIDDIGADLHAGRRVLLAHGTTPLIWNGSREVPLDRGNTILELLYGKRMDLTTKMSERFGARYYDRIYAVGTWYIWNIPQIQQYYREVDRIPRAEVRRVWPPFPYRWGVTHVYEMMGEVVVYEPR